MSASLTSTTCIELDVPFSECSLVRAMVRAKRMRSFAEILNVRSLKSSKSVCYVFGLPTNGVNPRCCDGSGMEAALPSFSLGQTELFSS